MTASTDFLRAFLRNPATTGAIAPSSERLARVLASVVTVSGTPTVLELGPGAAGVDRRLVLAFAVALDALQDR